MTEERRAAEEQKRQTDKEEHRRREKEAWLQQREEDNKRWETLFRHQFQLFREHTERKKEQRDKEFEEKAHRKIRRPKLKEADDIESFPLAFERQMRTQGPPQSKWVTHL